MLCQQMIVIKLKKLEQYVPNNAGDNVHSCPNCKYSSLIQVRIQAMHYRDDQLEIYNSCKYSSLNPGHALQRWSVGDVQQ